jgi:hypothetical protein
MLQYKALQVIAAVVLEPKDWEMGDRKGTTHAAKLAVLGKAGDVASITIKAKTADELKAKLALYPAGKAAEVPIVGVVPVFKAGDRKPSAYEYTG